jgi:hypothetical protein
LISTSSAGGSISFSAQAPEQQECNRTERRERCANAIRSEHQESPFAAAAGAGFAGAAGDFTADVAQLQLDGRAIDLSLRIRSKRRRELGACALRIALCDQRVAANLVRLRSECAGLLDVQNCSSFVVLAGLDQQARQPQPRDLRQLLVA